MKVRNQIDFNAIEADIKSKVNNTLAEIGQRAVDYAKENGNYRDVSGNLRRSNFYSVEQGKLTVGNNAPYASKVESRGIDVISGAALYTENELGKITK